MPDMPDELVNEVTERYIEVYETLTGQSFIKADSTDIPGRIYANIMGAMKALGMK